MYALLHQHEAPYRSWSCMANLPQYLNSIQSAFVLWDSNLMFDLFLSPCSHWAPYLSFDSAEEFYTLWNPIPWDTDAANVLQWLIFIQVHPSSHKWAFVCDKLSVWPESEIGENIKAGVTKHGNSANSIVSFSLQIRLLHENENLVGCPG